MVYISKHFSMPVKLATYRIKWASTEAKIYLQAWKYEKSFFEWSEENITEWRKSYIIFILFGKYFFSLSLSLSHTQHTSIFLYSQLLHILTSIWMLHSTNAGWNLLLSKNEHSLPYSQALVDKKCWSSTLEY